MSERWQRTREYLRKEFTSWLTKGVFSLALAGIVWVFTSMEWYRFAALIVCVPLLIVSGIAIVR